MRICPVCNHRVLGRRDKIFCQSKCRYIHYLQRHETDLELYRNTDSRLKTSHQILRRTLNNRDNASLVISQLDIEKLLTLTHYSASLKPNQYLIYDIIIELQRDANKIRLLKLSDPMA